jgi:hypothetical protein
LTIFENLKKLLTILFLSVYLISTTELHQLMKLPMVFIHFSEHKKLDSQITFLQFLDMHYMHGSPKDKDYQEDMKLPFKTDHNCVSTVFAAYIHQKKYTLTNKSTDISQIGIPLLKNQFILSSFTTCIWQPPQFS